MLRRSPDGNVQVWTLILSRPKWLPDWNYWALIPAVALLAVAILGSSWPSPKPSSHEAQTQPAQSAQKIPTPEETNERMANYTEALAWFTGALVVVALLEIVYLSRTDKTMKASVDVADRQFKMLAVQADILERQQGLARTQFFASHRPKIVIRDLILGWPTEGNPVSATFVLSNGGESNCTISEYSFSLCKYINGVGWPTLVDNGLSNIIGKSIVPGQRMKMLILSSITRDEFRKEQSTADLTPMAGRAPYKQYMHIIFEGYVAYDDINGLRRRSSFYRSYNFTRDRFDRADDPEREYAD